MKAVKKINLLDATGDKVYLDEYGWVDSRLSVSVTGSVKGNGYGYGDVYHGRWDGDHIYIKDHHDNHIRFSELKWTNRKICDFDYHEVYTYGRRGCLQTIEEAVVSFSWCGKEITALSKIEVYDGDGVDRALFDYQIKKGVRVQCKSGNYSRPGTFIVKKLFEQPNRDNNLCVIESLIKDEDGDATTLTIQCGERNLYSVPYEKYEEAPDETSIFNQPLNEIALAPFIEKSTNDHKTVNLYWLPIEEASGYIVSLYKRRVTEAEQQKYKMYLLERFEIDRNKHWFTLQNLIGQGYIVMLEAENRESEVIARTRGINAGTGKLEWF